MNSNSNNSNNDTSSKSVHSIPRAKKAVNFGSLVLEENEEKPSAAAATATVNNAFVKQGDQHLDALSKASSRLMHWWVEYTTGHYGKQVIRLQVYAAQPKKLSHYRIRALQQEAKRIHSEIQRAWKQTSDDLLDYHGIYDGVMQYLAEGTLSMKHATALPPLLSTIQQIPIAFIESSKDQLLRSVEHVYMTLRQHARTAHENRNNTRRASKWNDPIATPMKPEHRLPPAAKQPFRAPRS